VTKNLQVNFICSSQTQHTGVSTREHTYITFFLHISVSFMAQEAANS